MACCRERGELCCAYYGVIRSATGVTILWIDTPHKRGANDQRLAANDLQQPHAPSKDTANFGRISKSSTRTGRREAPAPDFPGHVRRDDCSTAVAEEVFSAASHTATAEPARADAATDSKSHRDDIDRAEHSGRRRNQASFQRN